MYSCELLTILHFEHFFDSDSLDNTQRSEETSENMVIQKHI